MREIYISKPDNRLTVKEIYEDFRAWVIGKYGIVTWNKISQRQVYSALKELPEYSYMRFKEGYCLKGISYKEEKSPNLSPRENLNQVPNENQNQVPNENLDQIINENLDQIINENSAQPTYLILNVLQTNPTIPITKFSISTNQPPINQPPINQSPINQPPTSQSPINQPPINQPLINRPLINQPPINQPLINQPPINQPLINQPPINQPPINQPPTSQPPINQSQINQSSINQPPINQSPILTLNVTKSVVPTIIEDIKISEPRHKSLVPRVPETIMPRTGQIKRN
ncbi:Hypothetical protein HVR_LOCUS1275 [uncultured virus]|nr:Hypothetical protein HVR_LOCUS1275 [uncultured virus]